MGRRADRGAVQIMRLLRPSHLIAFRGKLQDRIDLHRDRFFLRNLERVMRVIGVVIFVKEVVGCAARMRQQGIECLLLDLRIARNFARLADERRHFVALHPCRHVRRRCRR